MIFIINLSIVYEWQPLEYNTPIMVIKTIDKSQIVDAFSQKNCKLCVKIEIIKKFCGFCSLRIIRFYCIYINLVTKKKMITSSAISTSLIRHTESFVSKTVFSRVFQSNKVSFTCHFRNNFYQTNRKMSNKSIDEKFKLPKRHRGSTQSVWLVNQLL